MLNLASAERLRMQVLAPLGSPPVVSEVEPTAKSPALVRRPPLRLRSGQTSMCILRCLYAVAFANNC